MFAAAVGRTALHNDALAKGLIDGLCAPDGFVPARASQALVEAIHAGAAEAVLDRLLATPLGSLAGKPPKMDAVAAVAMALSTVVDEHRAQALAAHIGRMVGGNSGVVPRMVAALLLLDGNAAELDPALRGLVAALPWNC